MAAARPSSLSCTASSQAAIGPSWKPWCVPATSRPSTPILARTRSIYVLEGAFVAYVGDQKFEVEAGSYAALPNNVPHGFAVRGEQARLLLTVNPAGAEYFFVPRDESDADPAKFGIVLHERAPAV